MSAASCGTAGRMGREDLAAGRWAGHIQLVLDLAGLGKRTPAKSSAELAVAAALGGVDSIQVRGKGLAASVLLDQTLAVITALREAGLEVPVLVNDRLDVALLAGADGVHLPESSFPPSRARACRELACLAAARRRRARPGRPAPMPVPPEVRADEPAFLAAGAGEPSFIMGRSVHSAEEARAPGTGDLDYVLFGHVFETGSKPGAAPRGVAALAQVVSACPVPVLAIGGITADNAAQVIEAGAAGIAVISAILDAHDPVEAAKALRRAVDAGRARKEGCSCASP